jgi:hypothetical protein
MRLRSTLDLSGVVALAITPALVALTAIVLWTNDRPPVLLADDAATVETRTAFEAELPVDYLARFELKVATGRQLRLIGGRGQAVATSVSSSGPVASGDVVGTLDGVAVLALHTSTPLHRVPARGDTGDDILALRAALRSIGQAGVDETGAWSASTERALKAAAGLTVDQPMPILIWLPTAQLPNLESPQLGEVVTETWGRVPDDVTAATAAAPVGLPSALATLRWMGTSLDGGVTVLVVIDNGLWSVAEESLNELPLAMDGPQQALELRVAPSDKLVGAQFDPADVVVDGDRTCMLRPDRSPFPVEIVEGRDGVTFAVATEAATLDGLEYLVGVGRDATARC